MPVGFAEPWVLICAPLALAMIVTLAIAGPKTIPAPRRVVIALARALFVVGLALALAGPHLAPVLPDEPLPAYGADLAETTNDTVNQPPTPPPPLPRLHGLTLGVVVAPADAAIAPQLGATILAELHDTAGVDAVAIAVASIAGDQAAIIQPLSRLDDAIDLPWPWGDGLGDEASLLRVRVQTSGSLLPLILSAIGEVERTADAGGAIDAATGTRVLPRVTMIRVWSERPLADADLATLALLNIAVHVAPLPSPDPPAGARVVDVSTQPATPMAGRPFALRVRTLALEPAAWHVRVQLGEQIVADAVPLEADGRGVGAWSIAGLIRPAGCTPLTVTLTHTGAGGDPIEVVHREGIIVREPPRWLVAGPDGSDGAPTDEGLDFIAITAADFGHVVDRLPRVPADLSGYHGAIVALEALFDIDDATLAALSSWVIDGGGALHVTTSGQSFVIDSEQVRRLSPLLPATLADPAAPIDDPPVNVNPTDDKIEVPLVTLMILIDTSGSMNEIVANKFSRAAYVRAAAEAAVDAVDEYDRICVYAFDTVTRRVLDPTAAGNAANRDTIKETIRREFPRSPAGLTGLLNACITARSVLERESTGAKHLVIISDGEETVNQLGDFAGEAKKLREAGITVSAIGIGNADPRTLLQLANAGYRYLTAEQVANEDAPAIPQFVIRGYDHDRAIAELRHHHEQQGVEPPPVEPREETLVARVGAFRVRPQVRASYFAEIADEDWPRIKGYTAATPWPAAMTLLTVGPVEDGDSDAEAPRDPLLCTWRLGLGEVSLFTSGFDKYAAPAWMLWGYTKGVVDAWMRATGSREAGAFRLRGEKVLALDDLPEAARAAVDRAIDPVQAPPMIALMARLVSPTGRRTEWSGASAWRVADAATQLRVQLVGRYAGGDDNDDARAPVALVGPNNAVIVLLPRELVDRYAGLSVAITDPALPPQASAVGIVALPTSSLLLALEPPVFDGAQWRPRDAAEAVVSAANAAAFAPTVYASGNGAAADTNTARDANVSPAVSESALESDPRAGPGSDDAPAPVHPPATWLQLIGLMAALAAVPVEIFARR